MQMKLMHSRPYSKSDTLNEDTLEITTNLVIMLDPTPELATWARAS